MFLFFSFPFSPFSFLNGCTSNLFSYSVIESIQPQIPLWLPFYNMQVGAYARKHRYLQQEHDEALQRLQMVERLLKQFDCTSSQELLTAVAEAEADLDMWYQMEGKRQQSLVNCIGLYKMNISEGLFGASYGVGMSAALNT